MLGQIDLIVMWLTPSEVVLIGSGREEVKKFVVPLTVIADMEVKNKDELYALIKTWMSGGAYSKAEIVWIVDNELCFKKDFKEKNDELDTAAAKFLEMLPFAETYSRVYDLKDGSKQVVAVNKSLLDAYRQGFEIQGYETKLEIPEIRLPEEVQKKGPVKEIYSLVVGKAGEFAKERLAQGIGKHVKREVLSSKSKEEKPKSQLPLLLSVFGVLFIILGIVIYVTYF